MQDAYCPPGFADRVSELATPCRCGHDRGDHLVDTPHACEPMRGRCPCRKFRPARSRKADHQADLVRVAGAR